MNSFVRECQDYAHVVKNEIRKIEKLFRKQVCVFDIRKRSQSVYPIGLLPESERSIRLRQQLLNNLLPETRIIAK